METHITAESVFSHHAVAAGLPALVEGAIEEYIASVAEKHKEAARCIREAWAAAQLALHADVQRWLTQAREHIEKPFPK